MADEVDDYMCDSLIPTQQAKVTKSIKKLQHRRHAPMKMKPITQVQSERREEGLVFPSL